MNNIRLYIKESLNELIHNVTWPTWPELLASTRVVIVASIVFALITLLMDTISSTVLKAIYNL